MEFECVKYKEKMEAEGATCSHPGDYCKYRTSCVIHFLDTEKKRTTSSVAKGTATSDLNEEQRAAND